MKKLCVAICLTVFVWILCANSTIYAAQSEMPVAGNARYFSSGMDHIMAVVNDQNELWLYYHDYLGYSEEYGYMYEYNASSDICFMTDVEMITEGDNKLFVLKTDGSLWGYRFDMKQEGESMGCIMQNVQKIAADGYYRFFILTEQNEVYYMEPKDIWVTVDGYTQRQTVMDFQMTYVDSHVVDICEGKAYLKKDGVYTYGINYSNGCYEIKLIKELPFQNAEKVWEYNGSYFVKDEQGGLWSWGDNGRGQLGNGGLYDSFGSYIYVGSFEAGVRAVPIKYSVPVKILDAVEQMWFDNSYIVAVGKDYSCWQWGDGQTIKAYVREENGHAVVGDWTYPAGWPDAEGYVPRTVTMQNWQTDIDSLDSILYKADGTLWWFHNGSQQYIYAGIWTGGGQTPVFQDVPVGAYYELPVQWAVQEEITNGTGKNTFSPDQTCTQAQILTFLWRAAGKPETSAENPYAHAQITSDQYYYSAMLWAYECGIVNDLSLDPSSGCKRSDVVLYLWRLSGTPVYGNDIVFRDVEPTAEYAQAVFWALEHSITTGTAPDTFSPDVLCTRGQIVTFLYRYFVQ